MDTTSFYVFNQVSVITYDDRFIYLYNWMNTIGVKIYRTNILSFNKNIISFKSLEDIDVDFLIKNNFISKSNDFNSLYDYIFNRCIYLEDRCLDIILFPSGYKCNLRCKYCYETHDNNRIYKKSDLSRLANIVGSNIDKKINISYFGGEPLLNYGWIVDFSQHINNSYRVSYSMTTNGYLLSEHRIRTLLKLGIRTFQITLDGLEDDHNNMRVTADNEGTWKTILNNILTFKNFDTDFDITIRVNFNEYSLDADRLNRFLYILSPIKYDKRFNLLFRPISDYRDHHNEFNNISQLSCKDNPFKRQLNLSILASRSGFFIGDVRLFTRLGGMVCYASKNNSLAIDGEFNILKCTVSLNKSYNIMGTVDRSGVIEYNSVRLNNWRKNLLYFDYECTKCFLFFQCQNRQCARACYIDKYNKVNCDRIKSLEIDIINLILSQKRLMKYLSKTTNTGGLCNGN